MLEGDCAAALQLTVAGRAPVPSLRSGQASQRQVREAIPSRKTSALARCVTCNLSAVDAVMFLSKTQTLSC